MRKTVTLCALLLAACATTPRKAEPPKRPPHQTYLVQTGDTLSSIAQAHYGEPGMTWRVATYNRRRGALADPDLIHPGQRIFLPTWFPIQDHTSEAIFDDSQYPVKTDGVGWRSHHPIYGGPRPHHGIDLVGTAESGVRAIHGGKAHIRKDKDLGDYIIVENECWRSLYAHLSETTVVEDERVQRYEVIGTVGTTGASTGTHLHLELARRNWCPGVLNDFYRAHGFRKLLSTHVRQ